MLLGPLRGALWLPRSATAGSWLGTYERELQEVFTAHVRPGDVVFDVGANVGFYSLLAARLVGPKGRVVAFEPAARNVALLEQHLRLNRVTNVIVIAARSLKLPGAASWPRGRIPRWDTSTRRVTRAVTRLS